LIEEYETDFLSLILHSTVESRREHYRTKLPND
jgi:hypothetical protein